MTFDIAIVLILLVAAYGGLPVVRASFDCPQMGTAHRVPACMFLSTQKVSKDSHVE
ncbi:exported protein of unknown function [Nitrospira defluvii]|uniref:Uncharacterized protein n=1 Tax=Nitrospira defluvii TaxID=330214 RepID=D8P8V0_9BACT|nr:exported protein of unknown function [Nitrospira defluvii]